MTDPDPIPSPRRKRDPEGTKAAILAAAFETFSERGYIKATLREIASRAGVTHGLVRRHFGTKEALFLQALPGTRNWASVVAPGGLARFPETSAAMFANRVEAGTGSDVLVALLRCSGDQTAEAGRRLYDVVRQATIDLYEPIIGGKDSTLKSEVILSLMIGLTFSRHVVRGGEIAELDNARFRALVERTLRDLLNT